MESSIIPVQPITFMDGKLFTAAEEGDMEVFRKHKGDLLCLVDGRRNTALHIYSRTGGLMVDESGFIGELSIPFVKHLVDKCPSLLLQPNDKGEIPLHLAARFGNYEIVEFLIKRAKEMPLPLPQPHDDLEGGTSSWLRTMLRIKDNDGNAAFHKGVESCNIDVVQRLLVKELDPDISFSANKNGETPIYIASKTSPNDDVVDAILHHCKSIDLDYGGPDGQTALHAAVVARDSDDHFDSSIVKKLIKVKKQLIKQANNKGRSPLHYAAHVGNRSAVELMLKTDASAAYMIEKERGMTALHMAAWSGHAEIMEDIIFDCPGCCEIVDKNGWIFLHYAVVPLQEGQLSTLFQIAPNANFYAVKDFNGNTPYRNQIREIMNEIYNTEGVAGIPPHQSFHEDTEDDKNPSTLENTLDKMRETHLLVATLIATVTFAAAIAVPGGYKEGNESESDNGTATLVHNSAFKAFVITNAMAFVSSLLAIFFHFLSVFINLKEAESLARKCILTADGFIVFATAAMVVAFSTGSYAVLESSMGIAITTCSIGLTFFPFSLIIPLLTYVFFKKGLI